QLKRRRFHKKSANRSSIQLLRPYWRLSRPTMSTPQAIHPVKQALLEKLHQEIVPELEALVQQLPERLVDFRQAETHLRQGMLKVAQHLLDKWGQVADRAISRPCCPKCGVPM